MLKSIQIEQPLLRNTSHYGKSNQTDYLKELIQFILCCRLNEGSIKIKILASHQCILGSNGLPVLLLTEENEILNRWTEYCSDLYNYETVGDPTVLDCPQIPDEEHHPILREEVEAVVKALVMGKVSQRG